MGTRRAGRALAAALAAAVLLAPSAAAEGPDGARVVATVHDARITESSGLVVSPTHPGLAWTVNDSGSSATVYGVSLRTGRTEAVLRLADTDARDWECMTASRAPDGTGLLWIGDTGDNRAVRDSVVLRLVREPRQLTPAAAGPTIVTPVSLRVRYDRPADVETMIWTPDGRLLLVTKSLFNSVIYQVPQRAVTEAVTGRSTSEAVTAVAIARAEQSLVTDGAALPDGRIVLRGYDTAVVYPDPRSGGQLAPQQNVAMPDHPQGETLAVVDRGTAVLVGSEGVRQPIWRVGLSASAANGGATSGAGEPTSTDAPRAGVPVPAATKGVGSVDSTPTPAPEESEPPPRVPRALYAVWMVGTLTTLVLILLRRKGLLPRRGRRHYG